MKHASCRQQACTSAGHSWTIEFLQDFGDLPLFIAGVGKLTHSTSSTSANVAVMKMADTGTKESKDCSGRGLCDTDDRVCTCEPEYDTSNGYNEEVWFRCRRLSEVSLCTRSGETARGLPRAIYSETRRETNTILELRLWSHLRLIQVGIHQCSISPMFFRRVFWLRNGSASDPA